MTSSQGKITRASSFGVFGGRQSPADTPDAGIVSKSKLESRYELLRTMTLPLSLSIPNTVPGFSPIPSAVCGTPLPTPGHSSKPPSLKMKSLPQDWRLCTSIQFQSPTKFEVLSCPGTSVGKGDGVPSPSFQFQENMKYWNYPDVPLSSATVTVLRNAKDSGTASFLQSRLARWLVGFRSVVDGLYNGTIPYFYVQFPDNLALFRRCPATAHDSVEKNGDDDDDVGESSECECEVLLSRSSAGMRSRLQELSIAFTRPFTDQSRVNTRSGRSGGCTSGVDAGMTGDDDDDEDTELFALDNDTHNTSLYTRVIITAARKSTPREDSTLLLMQGEWAVMGFVQFMCDTVTASQGTPNWTGFDVPSIISPTPFVHGCMQLLEVKVNGRVATSSTTPIPSSAIVTSSLAGFGSASVDAYSQRTQYCIKLVGPVLPFHVTRLCEVLTGCHRARATASREESFRVKIDVNKYSRTFTACGVGSEGETTANEYYWTPANTDTPWEAVLPT